MSSSPANVCKFNNLDSHLLLFHCAIPLEPSDLLFASGSISPAATIFPAANLSKPVLDPPDSTKKFPHIPAHCSGVNKEPSSVFCARKKLNAFSKFVLPLNLESTSLPFFLAATFDTSKL